MALNAKKRRLFWLVTILFILSVIGTLEWYFGKLYYYKQNQDFNAFVWNSETLWQFKPGFKGKTFGTQVNINQGGYRGEYFHPEPQPELRILCIGDSKTFGFHADDDKTFSAILQDTLNQQGHNTQVINAGVLGYSAVQSRARFEQLLYYKPDIAIFAPGHNDRRYLLFSEPDAQKNFTTQARLRRTIDFLGNSKILYGLIYELTQFKLKQVLHDPPPLNEVPVRVPVDTFEEEFHRFVEICQKNQIQPMLLWLPQNPIIFADLEKANRLLNNGQEEEALTILQESFPTMHVSGEAYCHYLMGQCYQKLGKHEKAIEHFNSHKPLGSLHGEALLRSQSPYFEVYDSIAQQYQITMLSSETAIKKVNEYHQNDNVMIELNRLEKYRDPLLDGTPYQPLIGGEVNDLDQFYGARYIDECHLDNLGHILIGLSLAQTISTMIN